MKQISKQIIDCFLRGNKVMIMGNGGSATQASHFAAELIGHMKKNRRALPAISLATDTSILTAVGNDYSFEEVFSRQVEALGKQGDILIGITTSGKSKNILKAIETASTMGIETLLLKPHGKDTPRIQEKHLHTIHMVCEEIEAYFCENYDNNIQ